MNGIANLLSINMISSANKRSHRIRNLILNTYKSIYIIMIFHDGHVDKVDILKKNSNPVDISEMIAIENIAISDIDLKNEAIKLSKDALQIITTTLWCEKIIQGWLAYSNSYIIGIFLFHVKHKQNDSLDYVWLINGDIPTHIINARYCTNWITAFDCYINDMQEWVDHVYKGLSIDNLKVHVNVPPEAIWAERLESRLSLLRLELEEIKYKSKY